jgi:hypothetical protein
VSLITKLLALATHSVNTFPDQLFGVEMDCSNREKPFLEYPGSGEKWGIFNMILCIIDFYESVMGQVKMGPNINILFVEEMPYFHRLNR